MKMIFDTHAHYDDSAFDSDRDELLTKLFSENVACIVRVQLWSFQSAALLLRNNMRICIVP